MKQSLGNSRAPELTEQNCESASALDIIQYAGRTNAKQKEEVYMGSTSVDSALCALSNKTYTIARHMNMRERDLSCIVTEKF